MRRVERDQRRETVAEGGKPVDQALIGLRLSLDHDEVRNPGARIGERQPTRQPEPDGALVAIDEPERVTHRLDHHQRLLTLPPEPGILALPPQPIRRQERGTRGRDSGAASCALPWLPALSLSALSWKAALSWKDCRSRSHSTRHSRSPRPPRWRSSLRLNAGSPGALASRPATAERAPASGSGRRWRLPGARTQQHRRDAGRLRRQRQSPARCQIEQARLAPGLDQHRPQRRTARGLRAGPQHVLRIARPHQKDARRVETELGQPRRVQTPGLGIENILPDPEDLAHLRRPDRQPHGKTRRRSEVRRSRRVNLMQRRTRDASAQRLIKRRRAEAHTPDRGRRGAQRRFGKAAPQIGQGERGGF
jgi:hypothetical protein